MISSETRKLVFPLYHSHHKSVASIIKVISRGLLEFQSLHHLSRQKKGRRKVWHHPLPNITEITTTPYSLHSTGQTQSCGHSQLKRILENIVFYFKKLGAWIKIYCHAFLLPKLAFFGLLGSQGGKFHDLESDTFGLESFIWPSQLNCRNLCFLNCKVEIVKVLLKKALGCKQ